MMYRIKNCFSLLVVVGTLLGCQTDDADMGDPSEDLFNQQQQTIEQYLTERNIATQQNEAGIHYRVLTENDTGASPQTNNIVNLYYRIEQLDGGLIAAREEASGVAPAPYIFNNDFLLVPRGLNELLSLMHEGEEYEFYLPSSWAYLDYNQTNVFPSNAIVRARLHLAEILTAEEYRQVEDKQIKAYLADQQIENADSLTAGVYYAQTEVGDTSVAVTNISVVSVRYTGSLLNGTVFDSNTDPGDKLLEFTVGQGGLIDGFLTGVRQMNLGEKGTVLIPSHEAYGPGVVAIPYNAVNDLLEDNAPARTIPPFAILRFDLEVVAVK